MFVGKVIKVIHRILENVGKIFPNKEKFLLDALNQLGKGWCKKKGIEENS